jgi:hypothetical protein
MKWSQENAFYCAGCSSSLIKIAYRKKVKDIAGR